MLVLKNINPLNQQQNHRFLWNY